MFLLIFGVGFIFIVAFVLSILMSPALAVEEESVEDTGSEKLSA
jgi:Na+-transporting methylmalonyl-CoA/oxaloacetate decarboxylase gamma subunit